uniref:C2H2-type domain-containing protein n=1 Tax=Heliothis virescens TaxID=7102 RepID=A0A2A4JJ58_HELVI
MLKNTFDIQLFHMETAPNHYICDDCILRLRDAAMFKQMVVQNEQTYLRVLEPKKIDNHKETKTLDDDMKEEIKCESPTAAEFYDEAYDADDDDKIIANIKMELSSQSDTLLDSVPLKEYTHKRSKLKKCKIKTDADKSSKDWSKIAERRGNGPILRENSLKLLANSTIFVFQWNKSRYRCFCCKEPFSDVTLLREHTDKQHSLKAIEKKIIDQQNRLVKVEISVLKCTICGENLQSLTTLRDHLIEAHNIIFELKEDLGVKNFSCALCNNPFASKDSLRRHMKRTHGVI